MHRREFFVATGIVAAGSRLSSISSANPSEVLIADLEKHIPEWMQEHTVPGVSIVLIKQGRIFWRRALGVTSTISKSPVNNDTIFEAASMSKPVFAYAVM